MIDFHRYVPFCLAAGNQDEALPPRGGKQILNYVPAKGTEEAITSTFA